jgi:Rieske Fe-S protein
MSNRRTFVKTAAGWALACETLVTIGVGGCSGSGDDDDGSTPTPGPTPVNGILTLPIVEYPDLSAVNGDQTFNITGTGKIIVAQVAAGTFVTIGASCPHQGGAIFWDAADQEFECGLHHSTFTTAGEVTGGFAQTDVANYPTTFDGTSIVIDLN